jgi:hypothetical protein
MTPQDFLEFPLQPGPASGFQSVQFREIEFLSGLREPGLIRRLAAEESAGERLERRLEQPTLWDAFVSLMEERGLPMPTDDETSRRGSLLRMMREERFADVSGGGGAPHARRALHPVAPPPRAHGGASDRREDRHGGIHRRPVPAWHAGQTLSTRSCGTFEAISDRPGRFPGSRSLRIAQVGPRTCRESGRRTSNTRCRFGERLPEHGGPEGGGE